MPTINTMSKCEFTDRLLADNNASWSVEGAEAIFDYLDDLGESVEFDLVAIRLEYEETALDDIIDYYRIDVDNAVDEDERIEIVRDFLEGETAVLAETRDGFVFVTF